jgi:hypothetical protein
MYTRVLMLTSLLFFIATGAAAGDWDPGDAALFVQTPNTTSTGMDVRISWQLWHYTIADDFSVDRDTGLTDLHIWGSWLNDEKPMWGPDDITFWFGIYDDIPAGIGGKLYSRPGNLLWSSSDVWGNGVSPTSVRLYADNCHEGWLEPGAWVYQPDADQQCWQYNFEFGQSVFNLEAGKVYWLSVEASPGDLPPPEGGIAQFGWKTSSGGWNDSATYRDPETLQWKILDPPDPLIGAQQLAFVITPEPTTMLLLGVGGILIRCRR